MTRFWVIAPYHADRPDEWERIWQFDFDNSLISIGWAKLGNISILDQHELRALLDRTLDRFYPHSSKAHVFRMLWNFYHSIQPGDFVIARRGTKNIAAVGIVTSNAYYEKAKNAVGQEYPHSNHINVKWQLSPRDKQFCSTVFTKFTVYEIPEEKFRKLVGSDGSSKEQNTDSNIIHASTINSVRRIEMPDGRDGFQELDELDEDQSSDPDELEDEPEPEPFATRRRIFTEKLDPKISDLHQDWKGGDLILDPTFQRRKVWEDARSSRLVESALLEVPLPVFY